MCSPRILHLTGLDVLLLQYDTQSFSKLVENMNPAERVNMQVIRATL
jgi:hypothetical protein